MQMAFNIRSLKHCFEKCFRKRNIIIVSDSKVKHISISAHTQLGLTMVMMACLCWLSYSTGSYISDRSTLKAQRQALRQVTNARIDSGFSPVLSATPLPASVMPSPAVAGNGATPTSIVANSSQGAPDSNALFARISFLERKVSELQTTNSSIIHRVQDKTSGHIDDLETIIKQTGLSPENLKKQAADTKSAKAAGNAAAQNTPTGKAQGGPYIPVSSIDPSSDEAALFTNLDQLRVLRQIVSNLPLALPIQGADEQSTFGRRFDPFTGRLAFHSGLDLAGPVGSKIYSTAEGKVTHAERSGAYGNMIDIDHGFGISTRYGHLSAILVKEGQTVHKGQLIGIQGSTGRSTGPHLHYEVRYNDEPMNPRNFLNAGHYVSQE